MMFNLKLFFVIFLIACAPACHANDQQLNEIIKARADKKILWVTDTHLGSSNTDAFVRAIKNNSCEAIFITGDIADGNLVETLRAIADRVTMPIYFVLGNSDNAYGSSTKEIRQNLAVLMKEKTNLHYLHDSPIYFEPRNMITGVKTAVVGMDGYADSWNVSEVQRQEDLATFERNVRNAISKGAKRIVILTHVPPFVTDCWYKGEVATAKNAPHYSSAQSATLFLNLANEHPNVMFVVYSGHTHNSSYQAYPSTAALSDTKRKPNLFVYVGEKFLDKTDALGNGNFAGMYRLDQNRFLPDSFEFLRSGKITVLKNGASPMCTKDVPSKDIVTSLTLVK